MTDRFDPLPAAGPRSAPPCASVLQRTKNIHANCAKPAASFAGARFTCETHDENARKIAARLIACIRSSG